MVDDTLMKALNAAARLYKPPVPLPTKLPNRTSKICPHCLEKYGKKYHRKREYRRSIPLSFKEVNPELVIRGARVSSSNSFWNCGYIRYWIAPPEITVERDKIDPNSFPWFECWCMATCPRCGPERIHELEYARQFGRIRIVILNFDEKIPNLRAVIFSQQ